MAWVYIRTKDKFDGPIFGGKGKRQAYVQGVYDWEGKHFNLQSV